MGLAILDQFLEEHHEYYVKAMIILNEYDKAGKSIGTEDLMTLTGISDRDRQQLWDCLWHTGILECTESKLKNSMVKFRDKGRLEFKKMNRDYFNSTGEFLDVKKNNAMTYDETLEFVFQEHKKDNGKMHIYHGWKESIPEHFTDARKEMILSGMIIQDEQLLGVSRLNPKTKTCNSYKEAELKLEQLNSFVQNVQNISENSGVAMVGSKAETVASTTTTNTPTIKEEIPKKWYEKYLTKEILLPLSKEVAKYVIPLIIGFLSGRASVNKEKIGQSIQQQAPAKLQPLTAENNQKKP